ncbi:MAG: hypothetical protein CL663_06750 [Bacteroidetes bacterium]|nr:hypothetical protein [Bacteroidota bacterium]
MKKLIITIVFIACSALLHAQDYETSVGLRLGNSYGVSVKHFVSRYNAVEGILSSRFSGYILTGLYTYNNEMYEPGLNWYYGIGAHIGHFKGNRTSWPDWWDNNINDPMTIVGADAILGIEYVFYNTPISISFDLKPGFNLMGNSNIWWDEFGLTFRYIIK